MIELVILDVDGTITDQNRIISTKAIESIRAAEQNGTVVSLISGNVIPVMYALKIFLGINGPVFAENGFEAIFPKNVIMRGQFLVEDHELIEDHRGLHTKDLKAANP